MADVPPLPKKKPVLDLKKDLRPISLAPCVSKVAEEFVVEDFVKPAVLDVIRGNQYSGVLCNSQLFIQSDVRIHKSLQSFCIHGCHECLTVTLI